jgi:thiamine pyrophosphate-dependent acetolactate synthase large subunit-like protein
VLGACKLALHFKLTVLAEHIQAFINQHIEWEEEQAAAAAAAAQQVRSCKGVGVCLIWSGCTALS